MPNSHGRQGRRRRVLNEEVLSASTLGIPARSKQEETLPPGDTPRYGAGANIENHPQVTDFVPRRFRIIALLLFVGLGLGACGELVARYSDLLSQALPAVSAEELASRIGGGLIAWTSAIALLVSACSARLLFSLRRHRVDDVRGRYRIWRLVSTVAVLLSLNAILGGHTLLAQALGHLSGWTVLPGNTLWWLVPTAVVGSWLVLKMILEARECRSAILTYTLASAVFAVAGLAQCWAPIWTADYHETLSRLLPLLGDLLVATATLLFARFVVLDVQGLIERPEVSDATPAVLSVTSVQEEETAAPVPADQHQSQEVEPEQESAWIDGSEPEQDEGSNGQRKLSKAERKRLRKQKARNRAA